MNSRFVAGARHGYRICLALTTSLTYICGMEIEWDPNKSAECLKRRGFGFDFAGIAFKDPYRLVIPDDRREYGESRYILYGHIRARLYVVVYTMRDEDTVRIISAHKANKREVAKYAEATRTH